MATPSKNPPQNLRSPEVHKDGRVTFRVFAPHAKTVLLAEDIVPDLDPPAPVPLKRDKNGVWSVMVGPLAPNMYDYAFQIDGVRTPDPANWRVKGGAIPPVSRVNVPGPAADYFALKAGAHGIIQRHTYYSQTAEGWRELYIYLPPGYNPSQRYPVLYLLHGRGDLADSWLNLGFANRIADNLLAAGQIRPGLIVMPLGFVIPDSNALDAVDMWATIKNFPTELMHDIIPFVELTVAADPTPANRAVAGLSMGGFQSQGIALTYPEHFSAAGLFSGGMGKMAENYPDLDPQRINRALRLLYLANGDNDDLTGAFVRAAHNEFTELGIRHEYHLFAGGHTWPVWRHTLHHFLPRLWPTID